MGEMTTGEEERKDNERSVFFAFFSFFERREEK